MPRTKPRWMIDATTSEDWNEAVGYSYKKKKKKNMKWGDVFIYAVGLVQSSVVSP